MKMLIQVHMCANLMEIPSSSPHKSVAREFFPFASSCYEQWNLGKGEQPDPTQPQTSPSLRACHHSGKLWSFLMQHDKEHWVSLVGILKCPEPNPSRKIHATLPVLFYGMLGSWIVLTIW
jgi:hypothetical protein